VVPVNVLSSGDRTGGSNAPGTVDGVDSGAGARTSGEPWIVDGPCTPASTGDGALVGPDGIVDASFASSGDSAGPRGANGDTPPIIVALSGVVVWADACGPFGVWAVTGGCGPFVEGGVGFADACGPFGATGGGACVDDCGPIIVAFEANAGGGVGCVDDGGPFGANAGVCVDDCGPIIVAFGA
jgi:hypothetical protein